MSQLRESSRLALFDQENAKKGTKETQTGLVPQPVSMIRMYVFSPGIQRGRGMEGRLKQLAEVEWLREERPKEFVSVGIDPSGRSQKIPSMQN